MASQSERLMDFLPKVAVNRLSPPSEAGAKETGSLIIVRWHPQLQGPGRHFLADVRVRSTVGRCAVTPVQDLDNKREDCSESFLGYVKLI